MPVRRDIIRLRRELHRDPEISNNEYDTAEKISSFFEKTSPDKVVILGKTGRAFVFSGKEPGRTTVFRAELDALPISEESSLPHASRRPGRAHACGHDGHMAILAGLAERVAADRPRRGKTVLLFQPAEEVEQGARDVVENTRFLAFKPDYMFALHNIPGYPKHRILIRGGAFSAASRGMTIVLKGRTSHAAEPENGLNPVHAVERIIHDFTALGSEKDIFQKRVLLTFIHIRLGEIAFGTSPGYAEVRVTLRTFCNDDMELLASRTSRLVQQIANAEQLKYDISFSEEFPATDNHTEAVAMVKQAAADAGCTVDELPEPFRWSEDFAYYAGIAKTAIFGLGSGINQPQLHNPDFDFPDEIIGTGISVFYSLYKLHHCRP